MERSMEDKRTALAVMLCIIVVMVYSELFLAPVARQAPPVGGGVAPQVEAERPRTAGAASEAAAQKEIAQKQIAPSSSAGAVTTSQVHLTAADLQASPRVVVTTARSKLELITVGARFAAVELLNYKDHLGADQPLNLISHTENSALPGGVYVGQYTDELTRYKLIESSYKPGARGDFTVPSGGALTLTFGGVLPQGSRITKRYTFNDNYLIDVQVSVDPPVEGSRVWLEWNTFVRPEEIKARINGKLFMSLGQNNKLVRLPLDGVAGADTDGGANQWVSITDHYFMATMIPSSEGANTRIGRDGGVFLARVGGGVSDLKASVYVGPKDADLLKSLPGQLDRTIDLGTFAFLAHPLLSLLRLFFKLFGNYGLAIIALTLLIKLVFLPLTKASMKSMQQMQKIQPEMQALRERIKDPTQLNQEVLALYKRHNVNPMGGCLPMLIQIPVFLGLYQALLNSIELRHAPFALWIRDLSAPESLMVFGLPVPVMVLLMGASMYFQQLTTPAVGDPQQQKVMKLMPLIFTGMFVVFPMPAGLTMYWLVNNAISITQQVYLRKTEGGSALQATLLASVFIFGLGYTLTLV